MSEPPRIEATFTDDATQSLSRVERQFGQRLRDEAYEVAKKRQKEQDPPAPRITDSDVDEAYKRFVRPRKRFRSNVCEVLRMVGGAAVIGCWGTFWLGVPWVPAAVFGVGLVSLVLGIFLKP